MISYYNAQKLTTWAAYTMYLLLIPALIGLLINIRKIREYQQIAPQCASNDCKFAAMALSHHQWLLRTFVTLAALCALSISAFSYNLGLYLFGIFFIWWLYRIVRGMKMLMHNKAMPNCSDKHVFGAN